ncbi:MAG: TraR/DksA C4-type zinc finger protein [Bacteroidetes bacterium]|nr:TraR/DksA C4-type zinc finger protein [Bacteroidota bacterium]
MKKVSKPKSKGKPKSKPVKKSAVKKVAKKKPASKSKPKAAVKTKPKAKAKPVVKAKAKPVVKVKPKAVKKVVAVKAKPLAKKTASSKPITKIEKQVPAAKPAQAPVHNAFNKRMPYNKDEGRKIIRPKAAEVDPNKTRYSDKELEEFRAIINKKLLDAKRELVTLQAQLNSANEHGTDDTANTFKMLEDGSDSLAKEEAGQLASRQRKFIEQLDNALVRIENKTYGVCRVTGKLIPKERLRAVPHTTQSIEAKLNQYRD